MGPKSNLVTEVTDGELDWLLALNQQSVLHGLRLFSKSMHLGGEPGYIVSTASIYGLAPAKGAYGITKQAVVALTEAFQSALTSLESKITCAALCPSYVATNIADAEYEQGGGWGLSAKDQQRRAAMQSVIRHGASVEHLV